MDYDTTVDRIVDSVPQLFELVKNFFSDKNNKSNTNVDDDKIDIDIDL